MTRRRTAAPWTGGAVRILFDCRYTRLERHDGISRFTAELVGALGKRHPLVMLVSDERQLAMLPDLPWVLGPSPTSLLEPLIAPRALNRLEPEVVFSPMQTIGSLFRTHALVLTVHDLIYYSHPQPPRDLPWIVRALWRLYHLGYWPQRLLLNRADGIATVSETTRDLLVRHRLTRRPVRVVSNAVDHPDEAPRREPPATQDVLYAGSFMPYKNVETLARAMHRLPGWRLRLLSRASDATRAELEALAPAGALDFMGGASDEAYAAALRDARALVTASREEGFGLPVLEAMAAGTPVAVSDIPIFREITGGHAEFFDPASPDSAAAAIERLADDTRWAERSAEGERWSRRYDWGGSADELLAFCLRVLSERGSSPR